MTSSRLLLAEQAAAVRELSRRSGFRYFIRRFWSVIDSAPFVDSWHIGAVSEVLQAVSAGQISRVVINIPPGMSKSSLVAVLWPAWEWTQQPTLRYICTGFGAKLVSRDADRFRSILIDRLYRAAWPGAELTRSKPASYLIENVSRGRRFSSQLGSEITGWHGERFILDDPIKPDDATAIDGAVLSRANSLVTDFTNTRVVEGGAVVCMMQRLADNDPAGMLLDRGYEHLMLPMRYTPNAAWDRGCSLGQLDLRTEPGELLCPDRFSEKTVSEREAAFETPAVIAAQYDQNPTPATGSFFEADWFKYWDFLPKSGRFCQSWDLGFKGRGERGAREARSRVHGALWCWEGEHYYLVDEVIGHLNYPETKKKFISQQSKSRWCDAEALLVEDKANGPALIAELRVQYPLIRPIEPHGSKEDRSARQSSIVEAGRLYLPRAPWAEDFKSELVKFPKSKHNDRVDTTTQALEYMRDKAKRLAGLLRQLGENA